MQYDKLSMLREVWALLLLAAVLHAKNTAPLGRLEILDSSLDSTRVTVLCIVIISVKNFVY